MMALTMPLVKFYSVSGPFPSPEDVSSSRANLIHLCIPRT